MAWGALLPLLGPRAPPAHTLAHHQSACCHLRLPGRPTVAHHRPAELAPNSSCPGSGFKAHRSSNGHLATFPRWAQVSAVRTMSRWSSTSTLRPVFNFKKGPFNIKLSSRTVLLISITGIFSFLQKLLQISRSGREHDVEYANHWSSPFSPNWFRLLSHTPRIPSVSTRPSLDPYSHTPILP